MSNLGELGSSVARLFFFCFLSYIPLFLMVAGGSWAFYALGNGYVDGGCMMEVVWVRGCGLVGWL